MVKKDECTTIQEPVMEQAERQSNVEILGILEAELTDVDRLDADWRVTSAGNSSRATQELPRGGSRRTSTAVRSLTATPKSAARAIYADGFIDLAHTTADRPFVLRGEAGGPPLLPSYGNRPHAPDLDGM